MSDAHEAPMIPRALLPTLLLLAAGAPVALAGPGFARIELRDVSHGQHETRTVTLTAAGELTWTVLPPGQEVREGSGRVDPEQLDEVARLLPAAKLAQLPAVLPQTPGFGGGSFVLRVTREDGGVRQVRGYRYPARVAPLARALLALARDVESAPAGGVVGALGGEPEAAAPLTKAELDAKVQEHARASWKRWVERHYAEMIEENPEDADLYREAREEDRKQFGFRLTRDEGMLSDFDWDEREFEDAAGQVVPRVSLLVIGVDASPTEPSPTAWIWVLVIDRRTGALLHEYEAINYF